MDKKQVEILWREEKYHVMFHSQYHYNTIRIAMKNARYADIQPLISEALRVPPTLGSQRNAIMHMWGYFKKYAIAEEKTAYEQLLQADDFDGLLKLLKTLAEKYKVTYLLESRILKD
ncbi:YbgA family protein [Solibacillus sp. FSL R7-0668]|uniref:YbgA family protein n=1 Tax=Solibacillus sp. FSL R7-0668 TaxID=2921688 RepID=UPI0030F6AFD8